MSLRGIYCQWPCCMGEMRIVIALMAFLAIIIAMCERASLHIAIVVMVDYEFINATCPNAGGPNVIKNIKGGQANWSESEQGFILGAFYLGYVVAQVPAGLLCDTYGPRYPLLVGMIVSSISTYLIPVCTMITNSYWGVFALRILTGISQGVFYPGVSYLITNWVPQTDFAKATSTIFAAEAIGRALGLLATGMLIHILEGWPILFYSWAGLGIVYCLLHFVYVFSSPQTHPYIHPFELEFLQATLPKKERKKTPYKDIFKDQVLYGLIISEMGHDLLLYTMVNNLPKYLNQVLGFNMVENSLMSFLYFLQWFSGLLGGILADYLLKSRNVNKTLLRRAYTSISNLGCFLCICFGILFKCRIYYCISCFVLAIIFKGFYYPGGFVNILDVSLNHAGFVMSVVNGFGAIMGFVCSMGIGLFAHRNTFEEWELIIGAIGVWVVTSIIFYIVLAKARRSDWDYGNTEVLPGRSIGKRWYQEMTNSEHMLRVRKNHEAYTTMKEKAHLARATMKENIRNSRSGV